VIVLPCDSAVPWQSR